MEGVTAVLGGDRYGYEDDVYGSCSCGETRCHTHQVPGWSWCPVMERPVKESEGHRPAAARLCNGTPHLTLLVGGSRVGR